MLNKQTFVNFINEKLNEVDSNFKFNIVAEVGETKAGYLSGILLTNEAITSNIPNYTEANYSFTVAILVPSARTNENYLAVENIVSQFVKSYDATEQTFDGVNITLTMTLGKPDTLNTAFEVGNNVPLYFTIKGLYGNNVTSTNKHWFLDGVEIPFEREGVYLNKDGRTSKIQGIYNTQTLPTGVTKQYKFVFPYSTNFSTLQQDILSGDFKKIYTLTYYDGVSFTSESPFSTKVSIFSTGDNESSRTKTAKFNITFTDVDDGETAVKYFLALVDFPFDDEGEDTRWFNTRAEQETYFLAKVQAGCQFEQIKAPNINSLNITQQIYENTHNYDLLSLMNKNYAVIQIIKKVAGVTITQYLYYYIQSCQVGANNQFLLDLKMDVIQTYFIGGRIDFGDCYIEKANLNRWIDNGNGTVSFDGNVDSKLFEREDIQNVAKRLTKRTKLSFYPDTVLGNWLNENILTWLYVYVDPTHNYSVYEKDYSSASVPFHKINNITHNDGVLQSNISVLPFPIMKNNKTIYLQVQKNGVMYPRRWNLTCFDSFLGTNNDYSYVYATKISPYPPSTTYENITYSIDTYGDLYITENDVSGTTILNPLVNDGGISYLVDLTDDFGIITQQRTNSNHALLNYTSDFNYTFTTRSVIKSNKNSEYNPKLLSGDYTSIRLCDQTEDGFDYDVQKLNKNNLTIKYTETIEPDLAKIYIRFTDLDGVYIEDTDQNLTGFINSNETSIIMPTTAYQSMLAQNKNYFIQNDTNRKFALTKGLVGGAFGIAGGSVTEKASSKALGIYGGVWSLANSGLNYAQSKINENLTIDNLTNAPANIIGAKGNAVFENMYSESGVIVEEYNILPHEKEIANDYMVKYGFNTNIIGNIYDYMNGNNQNARKYFNFIKAQIGAMSGVPLSNTARTEIRNKFANGLRFWNSDNIDYDKENYEKWLETTKLVKAKIFNVGSITETVTMRNEYNDSTTSGELYTYKNDTLFLDVPIGYVLTIDNVDTDATEYSVLYSNVITYTNATYINVDYRIETEI